MKRITSLLLIMCLLMTSQVTYANKFIEENEVSMTNPLTGETGVYTTVNLMMSGQDMITDTPGILYVSGSSTRTLVPISFIVDAMGASISWKQSTREVSIVTSDKTLVMQIGNPMATVNGKQVKLPDGIAPILLTYEDLNKTYVPVKFISDQLGLDVNWIGETRTVAINKEMQTISNINLDYMKRFPEIRLKVTGEVEETSYHIDGSSVGGQDKIVVDFQNTKFDLVDKSMLNNGIGTYKVSDGIFGIDKVQIESKSDNPPTTRVTVYLNESKGHQIFYDRATGEMVIQLVNTVNEVQYKQQFGTDSVVIETSEMANYNVNLVGNKVYVDVFNSYLEASGGAPTMVPVGKGKVSSLSYTQLDTSGYSDSDVYTSDDVITRVAVNLNEEITYDELYIEPEGNNIVVYVSQNPLNNFEYVKLSDSKGNLSLRLFENADVATNYNASNRQLTISIPKTATNLNAFDYPVDDQIVKDVVIGESGNNYVVTVTLAENTTYSKLSVDSAVAFNFTNTQILNSDYKDTLIVIDAGHGGHDSGAVGSKVYEKDMALASALELEKQLKQKGFKVYMTRSTDVFVDLYERADIANELGADLFISIHYNATTNSTAHGVEVLYAGDGKRDSHSLAEDIQPYLVKDLKAVDRGTVYRPNLVVLRKTKMPAVLCELGFVTNPEEQDKMLNPSYVSTSAASIVKGIEKYLK